MTDATTPPRTNEDYDAITERVAALLPFPVELEADMGGTFTLQIELGRRRGEYDEPDRADLEPHPGAVWTFETEGGREYVESPFDADADPADVAAWIATEARRAGSPAAAHDLAALGFARPPRAAVTATPTHSSARPDQHPPTAPELSR